MRKCTHAFPCRFGRLGFRSHLFPSNEFCKATFKCTPDAIQRGTLEFLTPRVVFISTRAVQTCHKLMQFQLHAGGKDLCSPLGLRQLSQSFTVFLSLGRVTELVTYNGTHELEGSQCRDTTKWLSTLRMRKTQNKLQNFSHK